MRRAGSLALGIGADSRVSEAELTALVRRALDSQGLSPGDVACIASLDSRQNVPALHALAKALGVPTRFFDAVTLSAETLRLPNPSARVEAATGVAGVAEAAALVASGPNSELIVPKTKSPHATCAVARRVKR